MGVVNNVTIKSKTESSLSDICLMISPWSPEGQAILLTGQANGGSVHNGHELFDIRSQQTVEQLLIPVLQCHQQDVPETEKKHMFISCNILLLLNQVNISAC